MDMSIHVAIIGAITSNSAGNLRQEFVLLIYALCYQAVNTVTAKRLSLILSENLSFNSSVKNVIF